MKANAAVLACLLLCVQTARAGQLPRDISWSSLRRQGKPVSGQILPADAKTAFERLKITNAGPAAKTATVLTLTDPGITKGLYAVRGQVRYEDVAGAGYLE
ncbi:hypothetical protein LCGC14_2932760, partial [marine sediment metagenome]